MAAQTHRLLQGDNEDDGETGHRNNIRQGQPRRLIDSMVPFTFYNIRFVKDFIHESHGRRYYVTHGDIFDTVTSNMKWLAMLGDVGYTFLLWLNKIYNNYRTAHASLTIRCRRPSSRK